jgi:hypothetical protein
MYCWAAHVPTLSGALPFAVALRLFNPDFAAAAMLWCWVLALHDPVAVELLCMSESRLEAEVAQLRSRIVLPIT